MRTSAGYFFMGNAKYTKPALTLEQQLELLIQQGLIINDKELAYQALKSVGYYRLSGYLLPFKLPHHHSKPRQFKENTTFEQGLQLYEFDCKLRSLVLRAIEKIEIAVRAGISNVTSLHWGAFGYLEGTNYKAAKPYELLIRNVEKIIKDKHEVFIQHYLQKYNEPSYPPIWMMIEVLSFGVCSKLFTNIKDIHIRLEIAQHFNQHTTVIESWLRALTYTRNLCAHHSRLCNRWLVNIPILPKQDALSPHMASKQFHIAVIFYVIVRLLEAIEPHSSWRQELYALFSDYPLIPGPAMGFETDWRHDPFWENRSW